MYNGAAQDFTPHKVVTVKENSPNSVVSHCVCFYTVKVVAFYLPLVLQPQLDPSRGE